MKKIPAFTLMELLIGMIISSIVIGFGYATYSLIYKQYLGYKDVKEKIVELTQLDHVLRTDLITAEIISFNDNKLFLSGKDFKIVQYHFQDSLIVRTANEVKDTFQVSPVHIKAGFLLPDKMMFLTQFSFDAEALDEKEHFAFTKDYSSETLMTYEPFVKNQ
jgi:prepilin-type N-terminal cleavage/methylation domain-containing protein